MGICASCLGLNRHPSQDNDESDPLLDDSHAQYGGIGSEDVAQPDEEELRREREAFQQITAEASDNMIDVSHSGTSELSHHFAHGGSQRFHHADGAPKQPDNPEEELVEDEEAAWLQSIQGAGADNMTTVQGLQSGGLVLDIGTLRDDPSAAKRSLKANLPG